MAFNAGVVTQSHWEGLSMRVNHHAGVERLISRTSILRVLKPLEVALCNTPRLRGQEVDGASAQTVKLVSR